MARPRLIQSPEEAEERADAYFAQCVADEKPVTITGLALALGLSSRQSLIEYESREEFSDTIKSLKAYVEQCYEERLASGAAAGAIFALKNFGWTDKQTIEQTGLNGGPIRHDVTLTPEEAYKRLLDGSA